MLPLQVGASIPNATLCCYLSKNCGKIKLIHAFNDPRTKPKASERC